MTTPEGALKQEVKDFLKTLVPFCWFFMPVTFGMGIRGVPDFVVCYKGRFIGIETKAPGGKLSKWQQRIGQLITLAGGLYIVAYDIDEVKVAFPR